MKVPVVITDLTRMQHGRVCIAAYRRDYTCVRPVVPGGIHESWLFDHDRVVIRPFAVVELDLLEERPDPPHTEDWLFIPAHKVWLQQLPPERRWKILNRLEDPSVVSIFGADITHEQGWYVEAGSGDHSLGTIRPHHIHEVYYNVQENGKLRYALVFTDLSGQRYRLSVSDLAFRRYLDHLHIVRHMRERRAAHLVMNALSHAKVFLRIGLARGWDKHPDRCYLQITGVYSMPDYLDGRCFADFETTDDEPDPASTDEDLPF